MPGLKLRKEFRGTRLRGTAIELKNNSETGATQVKASDFLEITYPSEDLLRAIRSVGPEQARPVVLIGERGQGKSHIMAVLYHLLSDPAAIRSWLSDWSGHLGEAELAAIPLREGMQVISESLHRQTYKFLWDMLFDRHPRGEYIRGKWQGMGEKQTEVPGYDLLLELFREKPTALILDEYQTWFDGLTNTKQFPWRTWAFNFMQLLSEIAKEHPDLLVLAVSVRNGSSDAFQQIQRVNPVLVDFKGPNARQDRQRLLLHRLFENRMMVPEDQIQKRIQAHVSEYFRLTDTAPAEQEKVRGIFTEAWPYAPHLMQILEDQILVATHAQETRDLIKILAALFKQQGEAVPILTAADFRLNDGKSGVNALLDSVSDPHLAKLREKAQRNMEAVSEAVGNPLRDVPHLAEIMAALWLRSLAVGNRAGAAPLHLQADITRDRAVDDNAFRVELELIVENSFNIHHAGDHLIFREEENPQARLLANARNDKLFSDHSDLEQLAKEIRAVLFGKDDKNRRFQIIVLRTDWRTAPWAELPEEDHPDRWDKDRIPLLVLPENPDKPDARLGKWLKEHLQKGRNTIRFLLPQTADTGLFLDRDMLVLSRAVVLAGKWSGDDPRYPKLKKKYEGELQSILKKCFDRFAVLDVWDFMNPDRCLFQVSSHKAQGHAIPEAVDKYVRENLFIPEDFEELVLTAAQNNESVGKLLRELQEPRPNRQPCIPWLGETEIREKLLRICARGKIAISPRNKDYLQPIDGEEEEDTWKRIRGRLGTGKHLEETFVLLPQAVPNTGGLTDSSLNAGTGDNPDTGISPLSPGTGSIFTPGTNPPAPGVADSPASIFSGGSSSKPYTAPATSALNLLGQMEKWGINPGSRLQDFSISIGKLTGAQASQLLKSLPDGLTFALNLKKEE